MGVSLGIGALAEGAGAAAVDFALPAAITSGVEAGIADVGLGTLGAEAAGAGLAGDVAAGGLSDLAAGTTAAELVAAGVPELAAPVEAGAAAGALAPAASSLAPAVAEASPAVAGLGSAASSAIPGALAEGAEIAPLTETAVETAAAAPAAAAAPVDALATPLTTETAAVAPGAAAPAVETAAAPTTLASTAPETGLSSLAPGAPQVASDAAPLGGGAGTQLASAGPAATETSLSTPAVTSTAVSQPPVQTAQFGALQNAGALAPANPSLAPSGTFINGLGANMGASPIAGGLPESYAGAGGAMAYPDAALAGPAGSANIASSTGGVIDLTAPMSESAAQAGGEGLMSKAGSYLAKNPTSILSALGMVANLAKGNQPPKFSSELQAQAAALQAQGAQLQGYLTSGTLPPGIGSALQGAHDSAAAAIRSRYANTGMSGSSAEMQDLNNLAQTTVSQGADIANKLLATGVSEQQFASGLYQNLMATAMQQDTNMSNAIAGFTNAMAKASSVGS